ncbi:MAG: histidine phosphatase family protein [Myxococcota bacterium]|nr:histidine phosphatase family protein [Myxococcota bacterium]
MSRNATKLWQDIAKKGQIPLILARHGRTRHNLERRFVGKSDPPLDEQGLQEAQNLAMAVQNLELSGLYASELQRAKQTASAIGSPTVLEGIAELDQGELEGQRFEDVAQKHAAFFQQWHTDPDGLHTPGGESLNTCQERAVSALQSLRIHHKPGPPLLIVTHQMVLSVVLLHALGLPMRHWRLIKRKNTAMDMLGLDDSGELIVHHLNLAEHL